MPPLNASDNFPCAMANCFPSVDNFFKIWCRTGGRHLLQDRWQTLLLLAILSLGVATALSIRITNRASIASFEDTSQAISSGADFIVRSASGRLDQDQLPRLREILDPHPVALVPIIESFGVLLSSPDAPASNISGNRLRLLGMDFIGLGDALDRDALDKLSDNGDRLDVHGIYIGSKVAAANSLTVGNGVSIIIAGEIRQLPLSGVLPATFNRRTVPADIALLDLPQLQEFTRESRFVDRVEIHLPANGIDADAVQSLLATHLPENWIWETPEQRALLGSMVTSAFRLNLFILSLIALLTGMYLILMGLDAAVSRRRLEIAILRSLGIDPATIQKLWLLECLILGFLASILGLLLGSLMARVGQGIVLQTVQGFYGAQGSAALNLQMSDLILALLLGSGGSLLAGWFPAKDAAQTPPTQMLSSQTEPPAIPGFRSKTPGIIFLITGVIAAILPPAQPSVGQFIPWGGYLAALLWIFGGALLAGRLLPPLASAARRLFKGCSWWQWSLSRTQLAGPRRMLAVAGIYVATGMAASISFLVGSFEKSLTDWLSLRFNGDIYVSPAGFSGSATERMITADQWQQLIEQPGIAAYDPLRLVMIEIDRRPAVLTGTDLSLIDSCQPLMWIERYKNTDTSTSDILPTAYISENFALRFEKRPGDEMRLPTPQGYQTLRIQGIHADYGNDQGSVLIDWQWLSRWFDTEGITNITLFLEDPEQSLATTAQLREQFPLLEFRTQRQLRETALTIFRQTFAVTRGLQVIGIGVALGGILLTVLILGRESREEILTLRKLGMTRWQIGKASALEAGFWALCGLIAGAMLSFALGYLLIYSINYYSFGWTLQANYPWAEILQMATILTLLAALTGGWVGSRMMPGSRSSIRASGRWFVWAGPILLLLLMNGAHTPLSASSAVPAYTAEGFPVPQPHREHRFPEAHGSHPAFRIEWWYLTGQLKNAAGEYAYGYQATFFRYRETPLNLEKPDHPAFGRDTIHLAHMALSDFENEIFYYDEKLQRDGWDAYAKEKQLDVRNGNWTLKATAEDPFQMLLRFTPQDGVLVELELTPEKPLIIFGKDGTSRKGPDPDSRSYYFSFSRLNSEGQISIDGKEVAVSGTSWMDHEIASRQLSDHLEGWDWTAIHLDDGREIKAYILRDATGLPDPYSRLIWIDKDGNAEESGPETFEWQTIRRWRSPNSGIEYPTALQIKTTDPQSGQQIQLNLEPIFDHQELILKSGVSNYWEGACKVKDANGNTIGRAYLELVGYGGKMDGLR
jgi:putative ABC transport system permease protein